MTETNPREPIPQGLVLQGLAVVRGERLVLSGLDITLRSGEALVVTGPNGAGKSTLLRVLAGLLPRVAGVLAFDGCDPRADGLSYAAKLHYIGHRDGVKNAFTVGENLEFWMQLLGGAAAFDACLSALGGFGLGALADMPAALLSAGQRRRLALARLVAVPRPLWLLDEPGAGLDTASRAALGQAIARHCDHGGFVVMASHGELELPAARTLALEVAA